MNVAELLPLATGTATLVGAGVAGVVAHLTTRRTTLTTWRAKTAEWQDEALISFHDAALQLRGVPVGRGPNPGRLIAAWRRLELTGPDRLVKAALPVYEAARSMGCRPSLREWNDFFSRVRAERLFLADVLLRGEDEGRFSAEDMDAESAVE